MKLFKQLGHNITELTMPVKIIIVQAPEIEV
jgi:hypothetical protein